MNRARIGKWATLGLALTPLAFGCARDHRTVDEKMGAHMQAACDAIEKHVTDRARADQLLALLTQLDRVLTEQNGSLSGFMTSLHEQNADPAVTSTQLQASIDAYLGERQVRRAKALDIHFQMIELTQPDEWKHIVDAELEAIRLGVSTEGV